MPFKSGKSPKDVAQNLKDKVDDIANEKLEIALTTAAYAVGAAADFYVPIDTSALINSRQIRVMPREGGYRASIGYYQDYAAALHGTDTYSPLWKPVNPFEREWRQRSAANYVGNGMGGYNPAATPQWIMRGVEETDIDGIIKRVLAQ